MKDRIIEALKELGIKEVILEVEGGVPYVDFGCDDGATRMTNKDFAEGGL